MAGHVLAGDQGVSGRRGNHGDRRTGPGLRQVDDVDGLHGAANARAYKAGAIYANGEFVQVHPSAIPGADKLRLIRSGPGEAGRVWVPRSRAIGPIERNSETERWYSLEKYPTYGNLLPRDIATREIFQICRDGYSVSRTYAVYLDLTERPRASSARCWSTNSARFWICTGYKGVDPLSSRCRFSRRSITAWAAVGGL